MFSNACVTVREAVYGIMCCSQVGTRVNCTNGTAFMIAPGSIITAAHVVHVESKPNKPVHSSFEVIRTPDIGQPVELAQLIAEDTDKDLALLQITNPRSSTSVILEPNQVPRGTNCGSVGFPLASVVFSPTGRNFNLDERFQGAYVSAFATLTLPAGNQVSFYETDSMMYGGSSGCPGFTVNGKVFGLHSRQRVEQPTAGTGRPQNTPPSAGARLAISLWVASTEIRQFATANGVAIP